MLDKPFCQQVVHICEWNKIYTSIKFQLVEHSDVSP